VKALAFLLAMVAALSGVFAGRLAMSDGLAARFPAVVPSNGGVAGASHDLFGWLGATRLGRRLAGPAVSDALAVAGWAIDPVRFAGIRVAAAVGGMALGALVPFPGALLAPILAYAGARLPLFVAARRARHRRAQIDAEIPQLLDLLAAGSSAGLAAPLALRRANDGLQGPLAAELTRTLDAVDLGGRWRDELRELAERLRLPDFTRTVAAITRTESLGSSLSDSTAELAATVRATRRAGVTERARTAPVKMLFPLVFLVLPAFLLLTVVPVLLTTLQSIR
jgi:tight adherence protein C